jgi:lipopolysaccharide export system permease protein
VLFDRYLLRGVGSSFAAVTFLLTTIFLTYSVTRFLTDAAGGLLSGREVAALTAYKSVIALEVLVPLALYLGLIVGLSKLNSHNELTAMRALGFEQFQVARPLLISSFLLAALVLLLSVYLRPWAYAAMYALKDAAEAASDLDRVKPQRFYVYEEQERTIYLHSIDRFTGDVDSVFVRTRKPSGVEVITARHGRLHSFATPSEHRLDLFEASIFRNSPRANDVLGRFDRLSLSIPATQQPENSRRTKALSTADLLEGIAAEESAELQWRLSTPLSTFLLAIAAFFVVDNRPRQSLAGRLPLAIGLYAIYFNLLGLSRTWVEQGRFPTLLWVPALLAVVLGIEKTRRERAKAR